MRQIGTLPDPVQAERFTAYLITQGVTALVERDRDTWQVWVREEDHLAEAKAALQEFAADPEHPRYRGVLREASTKLQEEAARRERARRNLVTVREQWQRPGMRRHPLVATVIGLCAMMFVLSGFGTKDGSAAMRILGFCDTAHRAQPNWDSAQLSHRLIDISRGQVWRLITPVFLHGSVPHIVFNLLVFYSFAVRIEELRGTWRLALLFLITALVSNLAQGLGPSHWGTLGGGPFFCGLSGVVYGLLGYLWMKTVYDPGAGLHVGTGTVLFLLIFLLAGLTGMLDKVLSGAGGGAADRVQVANLSHLGGLLSGMAIGYGSALRRRA